VESWKSVYVLIVVPDPDYERGREQGRDDGHKAGGAGKRGNIRMIERSTAPPSLASSSMDDLSMLEISSHNSCSAASNSDYYNSPKRNNMSTAVKRRSSLQKTEEFLRGLNGLDLTIMKRDSSNDDPQHNNYGMSLPLLDDDVISGIRRNGYGYGSDGGSGSGSGGKLGATASFRFDSSGANNSNGIGAAATATTTTAFGKCIQNKQIKNNLNRNNGNNLIIADRMEHKNGGGGDFPPAEVNNLEMEIMQAFEDDDYDESNNRDIFESF
jgi:hypothetical protein